MGRWEPDARGRLEQAAMELFGERGYAQATVADIAARAGVTERTFFRYFADKREVLFGGSAMIERLIVEHIASAPDASPFELVAGGFELAGAELQANRDMDYVRARYALVTTHAELHERELIKMATLAASAARALRERGVTDPSATLAAEAGVAVFKVGFERWVGGDRRSLAANIRAATRTLGDVVSRPSRTRD